MDCLSGQPCSKEARAAVLRVMEISRITYDRFLVFNKADWLWLFHCVRLELIACKVGGAVMFYVAGL